MALITQLTSTTMTVTENCQLEISSQYSEPVIQQMGLLRLIGSYGFNMMQLCLLYKSDAADE